MANAISSDRVAHAILFSGPRGTGKTTVARILAKAMNCKEGPTPTPCNECRSCKEITAGSASDVFEIDGASNNGVDQIRELRENVRYMPAHSPHKIYIIDEVHMLSIAAFNALLKTLEEPPAHVMFLFATTEPHKIPITILSRCQRHDLRRISIESVAEHMAFLCSQEGIEIARESLDLIAREADGSMRDALSLLDQVMSCTEGSITQAQALDILGIIDRKILFDISASIFQGDIPDILDIFDTIYDHGHNIKELYSDLIEHFRNLLVVKMGKKLDKLVDVPAHEIRLMADQVRDVSEIHLSQLLDILFKEESFIRLSSQPKLALEMAFIRMFQTKPVLPIDALIEKLDLLKKGMGEHPANVHPPEPVAPTEIRRPATGYSKEPPTPVKTRDRESGPAPQKPESERDTHDETDPEIPLDRPAPLKPESEKDAVAGQREPEVPPEMPFNPSDSPDKIWEKLLSVVMEKYPLLGVTLKKGTLKSLTEQRLEIEISGNGFNVNRIGKNEALLKQICHDFFRKEMEVLIKVGEMQSNDREQRKNERERVRQEALAHDMTRAAVEIFGGRVVEVKILR